MIELAIQHASEDTAVDTATVEAETAIDATRHWLEKAVIGLNLCPFAKAVHVKNQIRYALSDARNQEDLLVDFICELKRLHASPPAELDTTLLIHPYVLNDFLAFNDFLDVAEAAIEQLGLEGEIQIASFHPDYRFADTAPDDISNYTNRSPFPVLHLLREVSIERAVASFPDASQIYEKNIKKLHEIGQEGWNALKLATKPDDT